MEGQRIETNMMWFNKKRKARRLIEIDSFKKYEELKEAFGHRLESKTMSSPVLKKYIDEVPLSDTWLEYINVPYSQNIKVAFNQRYSLPPTITANLIRNRNGANSGSSFGNYNISPNIDLIIEEEQGFLFYTGAHISFGTSAPSSVANGYISVQVVGRV